MILLSEKPHRVIQGEGNFIGKKMLLFRVAGCDIYCKDCDSAHTWNINNVDSVSVEDLKDFIYIERSKQYFDFVMITGGAPSIYMDDIYRLVNMSKDINFQIEDAGNKSWDKFKHIDNVYFSFSPKIGSLEGLTTIKDWHAFDSIYRNFICKVVVSIDNWEHDLKSIKDFQDRYSIPSNKIYLMPFGINEDSIIKGSQFIIDKCFEYDFNFSTRLHILLYGNKKLV